MWRSACRVNYCEQHAPRLCCRSAEGAAADAPVVGAVARLHAVGGVLPGAAGRKRLVRHAGELYDCPGGLTNPSPSCSDSGLCHVGSGGAGSCCGSYCTAVGARQNGSALMSRAGIVADSRSLWSGSCCTWAPSPALPAVATVAQMLCWQPLSRQLVCRRVVLG